MQQQNIEVDNVFANCSVDQYKRMQEDLAKFKSGIVRIRDILRPLAISGMDSMRHICLYLLARFMTLDRVAVLNVPKKFAWESMMSIIDTKTDEASERFYNLHGDCLVNHFDQLFGTEKFTFDIKDLDAHKDIMKIINDINLKNVDCQIDIMGWVYEQHLKTGTSSNSRDLGQYFTDRSVCEYMVKICDPKIKPDGSIESVCDPTMGTGGFLTAFMKHFEDEEVDWSKQQTCIHGCDTDPRVAAVARLNVFMEAGGIRFTNLRTHDSLYGDLPQETYDVILANMPFGVKQLKYEKCCERVQELGIKGTKSEPLFLQLMMVSLNKGGRCAVVVPDGMLVNTSKQHVETRKYLLDHFEVKKIIKMEGQFFMNTGIQPSIIYFKNTGKPTKKIAFWNVNKTEHGEIEEKLILTVPRDKIDKVGILDPKRFVDDNMNLVSADKYPMMKLEELCTHSNGKTLSSEEKKEGGQYPVLGGGTSYNGFYNEFNREGFTISVSKSGTAGFVKCHEQPFWAGDCFTVHPKNADVMNIKYLYYYLKACQGTIMERSVGMIPHCKWNDIKDMKICVPPMDVQEEAVAHLDEHQAQIDKMKALIDQADEKALSLIHI